MPDFFYSLIAITVTLVDLSLAIAATFHAVLCKRETRTVIGWVGLIWLSPFVGAMLYFFFGINRIERKGRKILNEIRSSSPQTTKMTAQNEKEVVAPFRFDQRLANVGQKLTDLELLPGNWVKPLIGGGDAYEAMLASIENAQSSIGLCSYIFDYDRAGKKFIDALVAAQNRGVEVRILVDHVGSRYSKPSAVKIMRQLGLNAATFLPTHTPVLATYANLRNHRKIMVIDGVVGFTGGMNIREGCLNEPGIPHAIQDIHFRIEGPAVEHLLDAFQADWAFATEEQLTGASWSGKHSSTGPIWARGIPDGPDADFDNIRLIMLAAIAIAHHRVDIVTPYFLPETSLVSALNVAAMRGVRVRILVPEQVNIRIVQWASMEPISRILERGCEVYASPPPFDHTKLLLIDDEWSLIGSSNWDPRSLRLNFEFNVECYGTDLNKSLSEIVEGKIQAARPVTQQDLDARPLIAKLRDGVARLATPYL